MMMWPPHTQAPVTRAQARALRVVAANDGTTRRSNTNRDKPGASIHWRCADALVAIGYATRGGQHGWLSLTNLGYALATHDFERDPEPIKPYPDETTPCTWADTDHVASTGEWVPAERLRRRGVA